jgi:hypothetical protein
LTLLSYLTRDDLQFFDSAAMEPQSSDASHVSLYGEERIYEMLGGASCLLVTTGQNKHWSLQSLDLF